MLIRSEQKTVESLKMVEILDIILICDHLVMSTLNTMILAQLGGASSQALQLRPSLDQRRVQKKDLERSIREDFTVVLFFSFFLNLLCSPKCSAS